MRFNKTLCLLFLLCLVPFNTYAVTFEYTPEQIKELEAQSKNALEKVRCPDGSKGTLFEGSIVCGLLDKDYQVNGVTVHKGSRITFNVRGQILKIDAAGGQKILDMALESGTSVYFSDDGRPATISHNKKLRDLDNVNTAHFYENGNFKEVWLDQDQKIGPCVFQKWTKPDTNGINAKPVYFHPNGQLQSGILSEKCSLKEWDSNKNIRVVEVPALTWVTFDAQGIVIKQDHPIARVLDRWIYRWDLRLNGPLINQIYPYIQEKFIKDMKLEITEEESKACLGRHPSTVQYDMTCSSLLFDTWNFEKALYEKYGGRVIGCSPVDAEIKFIEESRANKSIEILDDSYNTILDDWKKQYGPNPAYRTKEDADHCFAQYPSYDQ